VLTVQEPHDTITAALATLPPFERSVVVAYFIDGDPIGRIMRRSTLKRPEVVAAIETALVAMKDVLRGRGIRAVADVI
jgi:DNA-directed RNA polymerase specialized sigma24 family protein